MNKDTFLNPTYSDDQDHLSVIKYDSSDGFYLLAFVEGTKYEGNIQKDIKYYVDANDKLVDYVSEPHRTPIVSERLRDLILKYEKNIQVFDAPLFEVESKKKVSGYFILNYLNVLDCVDSSKSTFFEPVIIESKIPESTYIFRSVEMPYKTFFKRELALAVHKAGMIGIEFLTTQSY